MYQMGNSVKENTEEKILDAARQVFLLKGYDGARMQEIANSANINKGLLHYYFKSKDALFGKIFGLAFSTMIKRFAEILNSEVPLFEKIESFCAMYIGVVMKNPYLPRFVINEISKHPTTFVEKLRSKFPFPDFTAFNDQIKAEVAAGNIRPIDPQHLIVNILSMSVFPILAQPMLQMILTKSEEDYTRFVEERKKEVASFIIHSIRLKDVPPKQEEKPWKWKTT